MQSWESRSGLYVEVSVYVEVVSHTGETVCS